MMSRRSHWFWFSQSKGREEKIRMKWKAVSKDEMHLISGKISFLLNHHRNHCHNFYTDTPWILDSAYQPQLRVGGYDSFDARCKRVQIIFVQCCFLFELTSYCIRQLTAPVRTVKYKISLQTIQKYVVYDALHYVKLQKLLQSTNELSLALTF